MPDPVPLAALALDVALGWPAWLHARTGHPVGGFARLIGACARAWNRAEWPDAWRRLGGCATVLVLLAVAGGGGWAIAALARMLPASWSWMLVALAAWPALAQRSLWQHVAAVRDALAREDLAAARRAVGMIVGRDTATLDAAGVVRAAIESLAESLCDGVVAPFFWLLVGGLPGVWTCKAINTADSLIGHREAPWGPFGWAAARLDDAMNWIPARITGLVVCAAGGGGWRVLWRDHGAHASPNAGWSEAAMAGALGVRLAGPIAYDGVLADKPWLGDGPRPADLAALARALRIYARCCVALWLAAVAVLMLR